MRKRLAFVLLYQLLFVALFAQKNPEKALLWKVEGKDLKKPSFLFGTYHFLTSGFIDTLPVVREAFESTDGVVGELVMDASLTGAMMKAALLDSGTLRDLMPDTQYTRVASWFKRETGMDMSVFKKFKPVMVSTTAMAMVHQKEYPMKPGEQQLDTYFQATAKKAGKKVMGLEDVNIQVNALFGSSLERQVAQLAEMTRQPQSMREQLAVMNKAYISEDLPALQALMAAGTQSEEELNKLLHNRNAHWMEQLPGIMKEQPVFVAVGALHLVGESGLIYQLRKLGYKVTPLPIRGNKKS